MTDTTTVPRTDKELFARVRGMGLSIRKEHEWGGEYRITTPDGTPEEREARAYYTDDREDAFFTAVRMVENSY